MPLTAGIVGLPNVGKSTLFNAITKAGALAANYPFATIDPNDGVVEVPDNRLKKLTEIVKPNKTIPTTFEFTDIAGLVKGEPFFLSLNIHTALTIRETDAISNNNPYNKLLLLSKVGIIIKNASNILNIAITINSTLTVAIEFGIFLCMLFNISSLFLKYLVFELFI